MKTSPDKLFRTLSDTARRNIFEYLSRNGEQTVRVLTVYSGISQPAVSKHLRILKQAGLVNARQCGRETHYSARPQGLVPLFGWMDFYSNFWHKKFDQLENLLERMDEMTDTATGQRSVVIEKELPYSPGKVWKALTQPSLMNEWLMSNDFQPVPDHRFTLQAAWGTIDCQVIAIEPNKTLSYTWGSTGLESIVTWTLTPTSAGTHLCMEQSGFGEDQQQAYNGAKIGWPRFLASLEQVLAKMD